MMSNKYYYSIFFTTNFYQEKQRAKLMIVKKGLPLHRNVRIKYGPRIHVSNFSPRNPLVIDQRGWMIVRTK